MIVRVPVAPLWSRPDAATARDAQALAPEPDIAAWLSGMLQQQMLETEIVTQLLVGERVIVEQVRSDGWAHVVALDQPAKNLDPRGYPGWLRISHLRRECCPRENDYLVAPDFSNTPSGAAVVARARDFIGTPYVWGGLSAHGLDCSGLVHLVWRHFGVSLPRDAAEQSATTDAVSDPEPGDLYFFAYPGMPIHHVGIATETDHMVHASSVDHCVIEMQLSPAQRTTMVGARRGSSRESGAGREG